MSRAVAQSHRRLLAVFWLLVFFLAACSENDRLTTAMEVDEPSYREGQALLKTGRKQEALNAFLKVIAKRGDDAPESHLEIGLLYLQHINDPLSAIYHFKKYLALRPNSPQAPLVKQRIDAATREFARTLPAQPLEGQMQRVDLVATLERFKQENDALKQELADLKAGRNNSTPAPLPDPAETTTTTAPVPASSPFTFRIETMPTVRTRPAPTQPSRPSTQAPVRAAPVPTPAPVTVAPTSPAATTSRAASARKHTVRPGDTLSKISLQYYGNRTRWRDIYNANRNVMKSETDLKVGMELKLP